MAQAFYKSVARVTDPSGLGTIVIPMRVLCCAPHSAASLCIVEGYYAPTPQYAAAFQKILGEISARVYDFEKWTDESKWKVLLHHEFPLALTAAAVVNASCVRSAVYADPRAVETAAQQLDMLASAIAAEQFNNVRD